MVISSDPQSDAYDSATTAWDEDGALWAAESAMDGGNPAGYDVNESFDPQHKMGWATAAAITTARQIQDEVRTQQQASALRNKALGEESNSDNTFARLTSHRGRAVRYEPNGNSMIDVTPSGNNSSSLSEQASDHGVPWQPSESYESFPAGNSETEGTTTPNTGLLGAVNSAMSSKHLDKLFGTLFKKGSRGSYDEGNGDFGGGESGDDGDDSLPPFDFGPAFEPVYGGGGVFRPDGYAVVVPDVSAVVHEGFMCPICMTNFASSTALQDCYAQCSANLPTGETHGKSFVGVDEEPLSEASNLPSMDTMTSLKDSVKPFATESPVKYFSTLGENVIKSPEGVGSEEEDKNRIHLLAQALNTPPAEKRFQNEVTEAAETPDVTSVWANANVSKAVLAGSRKSLPNQLQNSPEKDDFSSSTRSSSQVLSFDTGGSLSNQENHVSSAEAIAATSTAVGSPEAPLQPLPPMLTSENICRDQRCGMTIMPDDRYCGHCGIEAPTRQQTLEQRRTVKLIDAAMTPTTTKDVNLSLRRTDRGYGFLFKHKVVHRVKAGSTAEVAGLKAEDILVSICGIEVSELPDTDVLEIIKQADPWLFLVVSRTQAVNSESHTDQYYDHYSIDEPLTSEISKIPSSVEPNYTSSGKSDNDSGNLFFVSDSNTIAANSKGLLQSVKTVNGPRQNPFTSPNTDTSSTAMKDELTKGHSALGSWSDGQAAAEEAASQELKDSYYVSLLRKRIESLEKDKSDIRTWETKVKHIGQAIHTKLTEALVAASLVPDESGISVRDAVASALAEAECLIAVHKGDDDPNTSLPVAFDGIQCDSSTVSVTDSLAGRKNSAAIKHIEAELSLLDDSPVNNIDEVVTDDEAKKINTGDVETTAQETELSNSALVDIIDRFIGEAVLQEATKAIAVEEAHFVAEEVDLIPTASDEIKKVASTSDAFFATLLAKSGQQTAPDSPSRGTDTFFANLITGSNSTTKESDDETY